MLSAISCSASQAGLATGYGQLLLVMRSTEPDTAEHLRSTTMPLGKSLSCRPV